MQRKKSRSLTFIFSLLPGAGHMYMGFMKIGLSFMAMFFFIIFLGNFFSAGSFLIIEPLVWFYAFFDCMNKASLNDEEFLLVEDKYLFSMDRMLELNEGLIKKNKFVVGCIVLLFGIYLLWNSILQRLWSVIPQFEYDLLMNITRAVPQIVISIIIIVIGIKLIMGKKKESDRNA